MIKLNIIKNELYENKIEIRLKNKTNELKLYKIYYL